MKRFIISLWVFIIMGFALSGCSDKKDAPVETTISSPISRDIPAASPTRKYPVVDPNCVYWVPKGEVYHSVDYCPYLNRSDEIKHGSIEEAKREGKNRPCSRCAK